MSIKQIRDQATEAWREAWFNKVPHTQLDLYVVNGEVRGYRAGNFLKWYWN